MRTLRPLIPPLCLLEIMNKGGDWAGAMYASSGCPSNCPGGYHFCAYMVTLFNLSQSDFVNNNPTAFDKGECSFHAL